MHLNIALCDDDNSISDSLKDNILKYSFQNNIDISCTKYNNGNELINAYKNNHKFDIIILDVEMPLINGIETAEILRQSFNCKALIIFNTSYPEYMREGFHVKAFDYLIKNDSENISTILDKCIKELISAPRLLLLNQDNIKEAVDISEIIYIRKNKDSTNYYSRTMNYHDSESLSYLYSTLQYHGFFECYKGYLVNFSYVKKIYNNHIELDNNISIPLSRRRKKLFEENFSKHLFPIY